jgi:hypothetical protein
MSEPRRTTARDDPEAAISLGIEVEKICAIVGMARRYDADAPPMEISDEAEDAFDAQGNALREQIAAAIDDLSGEESIEAVALVWLARGDFSVAEWEEAKALARERHTDHTADYLLG